MAALPLLLTPGEPAGVGPELAAAVAAGAEGVVIVADPELIEQAARRAGLKVRVRITSPGETLADPASDEIRCWPVSLRQPADPGELNPGNAGYVLETLERAVAAIGAGEAAGLVTGPLHKGLINDAGIAFSGHTEFLAERAGVERVVMMLVAGTLRVALATTHLPLRGVADAIDAAGLTRTLEVLHADLHDRFGLADPLIAVLGLNPHAGEGGHLGHEEIETIDPVVEALRDRGFRIEGPLPADTAFVPGRVERFDAVLAMYHDQGLPVLKYAGFGRAVNVTLGLPFVRTSVDHGTALDLAGTGRADPGSLRAALALAREMTEGDTGVASR